MNRTVMVMGGMIAVPIVTVLAISFGRDPHEIRTPMVGRTAPSFTLLDVATGEAVSLTSFLGRPVVINFWATWCVPCVQEHATLVSTARSLGSAVQFIGVVYDDSPGQVRDFLDKHGNPFPAVWDDDGRTAIAYGVYGVPETFFVDRSGTIAAKYTGALTSEALSQHVRVAGR